MIYGPYRSHASHGVSTTTRAAPRDDDDKRVTVSPYRRPAGDLRRSHGPTYFATALEQALRAWLARLA